jgi:hypothetical protein
MHGLNQPNRIIGGAVFEVNRVFRATGYKLGLLVNFTHPQSEIKRFVL